MVHSESDKRPLPFISLATFAPKSAQYLWGHAALQILPAYMSVQTRWARRSSFPKRHSPASPRATLASCQVDSQTHARQAHALHSVRSVRQYAASPRTRPSREHTTNVKTALSGCCCYFGGSGAMAGLALLYPHLPVVRQAAACRCETAKHFSAVPCSVLQGKPGRIRGAKNLAPISPEKVFERIWTIPGKDELCSLL